MFKKQCKAASFYSSSLTKNKTDPHSFERNAQLAPRRHETPVLY
jgi:hypothetical protein